MPQRPIDDGELSGESGTNVSGLFEFADHTDRSLSRWEHWFMDANGNVRSSAATSMHSVGYVEPVYSADRSLHSNPR